MSETVQSMTGWNTGHTLSLAALSVPLILASGGVVWRLGELAGAIQNLQTVLTRLEASDETLRAGIGDLRERVVVLERGLSLARR